MKHVKFLTPILFLAAFNSVYGEEKPNLFTGATKLSGYCTQEGQQEKFFEFVLTQDPQGGTESKYEHIGGNRVTVEYKSNGFPHHPVQYYHAKFLTHSFNGDLAVLEDSRSFEFMDHEQVIKTMLTPRNGVKVGCVAKVVAVK